MTETEKLNSQEMTRSLTGFDEIAIKKAFGARFEDLEGMFFARSLLFVQMRREGAGDAAAFKAVMEMTFGDVEDRFDKPAADAEGNSGGPAETTTT